MEYLRLIGVLIVLVGFSLRLRVTVIVVAAGLATGLVAAMPIVGNDVTPGIVDTLGRAFANSRIITLFVLSLPVIGLSERYGLQEQARRLILKIPVATVGRLQLVYQLFRVGIASAGIRLGSGHVAFSRPLVVPMALGAAGLDEKRDDEALETERVKGASGASENYGNFFGQNLFFGAAGVALVVSILNEQGFPVDPRRVSRWTLPIAAASIVVAAVQVLAARPLAAAAHGSAQPATAVIDALTSLEAVYVASGVLLIVFGGFTFADLANSSRVGTGLFWTLLGLAFALGGVLPAWATGALVIGMVVIDGFGLMGQGAYGEATPKERVREADRFGWRILIPVLLIPALTYTASLMPWGAGISGDRVVFVSLGYASVVAAFVALALTGARPVDLVHEGRRLADAIGAVVILPQLLASLGTLFTRAGVGDVIAKIVGTVIPTGSVFAVVLVCCLSIVAFTFVMGNSFAAFPVIMAGVGVPLLIKPFNADAALVSVTLLTCASCGTLCTPMAANFNMVPPALFEMRDRYGVIKFQAPFAAVMLVVHIVLLWTLVSAMR